MPKHVVFEWKYWLSEEQKQLLHERRFYSTLLYLPIDLFYVQQDAEI
jgi:hypothetical protein